MSEVAEVDSAVRRVEALVEAMPEAARLVQALMQLYGAGLSRIVEVIREESGDAILQRLAADKLTASLLMLHDLHPVDPETRLRKALQHLDRRLESQRLVLAEIRDGVARIRVEHNGGGAPPASLAEMIERAVIEAAPDLNAVEIEGAPSGLVQIAPANGV